MHSPRHSIYRLPLFFILLAALLLAIAPRTRAADVMAATEAELITAIDTVNAAGAGTHSITITADISLTGALPAFNNTDATEILVEGGLHLITGDQAHTVFTVAPATTVRVHDLEISSGAGSGGPGGDGGGAFYNEGHLTLENVSLSGNSAEIGGGIYSFAAEGETVSLTLDTTYLSFNQAAQGGGIASFSKGGTLNVAIKGSSIVEGDATQNGGGIYHTADVGVATLAIDESNIAGNIALTTGGGLFISATGGGQTTVSFTNGNLHTNEADVNAGGIYQYSENGSVAALTINNVSLYSNETSGEGGGILNSENLGNSTVSIAGSLLHDNTSLTNGGGIYNFSDGGTARVNLRNTTLSGNEAQLSGGGIYNNTPVGKAEVNLNYTTIADNTAPDGGGIATLGDSTTVNIGESIVSGNPGGDCLVKDTIVVSTGYNLDGDNSCGLDQPTDLPGGTADLQPLADNGGDSHTHALGATSDAVDQIPFGARDCGLIVNKDQRGISRPQGIRCDLGAFEADQSALDCTLPLTAANDAELNAAILCANAAGPGNHLITLTAGIILDAPAAMFHNPAAGEIALDGDGFTINADGTGSALSVGPSTIVRLFDLTVTGGQGSGGLDGKSGGAVYNRGLLTLEDSFLSGNKATHGAAIYNYGGLGNTAELTLTHVVITDNEATDEGGGVASVGDQGTVLVNIANSTISGNSAIKFGGALAGSGLAGTVTTTILDSTLADNNSAYGGGLYVNGNAGQSTATVDGVAITGNTVSVRGGGIFVNGNTGTAFVSVLNSTLSGNSANAGGGVAATNSAGTAEVELSFTTVADNTAANGTALFNANGALTEIAASILSKGSPGAACNTTGGGSFASMGYNLGDDASCNLTEPTDIPAGNPALLPLALNSPSDTETHAIDDDSDAQRRIPTGTSGCGGPVTTDQRGSPRPNPGAFCDIGAYESDAVPPPACVPPYMPGTETALNAAIACVNAAGAGAHLITLAADITLTGATTAIDNNVASEILIDGDGHTIDGDGHGPILSVAAGTTARLLDAVLFGGLASEGGGIYTLGALTVENSQVTDNTAVNGGGGIFNLGNLIVKGSTLNANTAEGGGAIATLAQSGDAMLTLSDSNVSGNSAGTGGGVYVYGESGHTATVSIKDTSFESNQSTGGAGGIGLVSGPTGDVTATLNGAQVLNNSGGTGGGLWARSDGGELSVNVNASRFGQNSATDGGGVALTSEDGGTATLLLAQTTLNGNTATATGGAILNRGTSGGTTGLNLFNTTLSANSSTGAGGGLHATVTGGTAGANVSYSTLADNTAGSGGGGIHVSGNGASVTLTATIIANGPGGSPDCSRPSGALVSTGYNLAGDATCFLTQGSDKPSTAPGLLPLALNAPGTTATHALASDSEALDHIPGGAAGCGTAITSDQRGAPRPQPAGGLCDIGAYESAPFAPVSYTLFLPITRKP